MSEHPAVVFLLAAHQQAEELARAATPGPWEPEGDDPTDDEVYTVHDGEHGDLVGNPVAYVRDGMWGRRGEGCTQANMRLIAGHADPVSVLRRVGAERRLLECHGLVHRDIGWLQDGEEECDEIPVCGFCVPRHSHFQRRKDIPEGPCRTVLLLAKAWGWTNS